MTYPKFVEDSHYYTLDDSKSETTQLNAMLSNLMRIHLLTANKFDSFDQLIQEYLKSGIEVFGLETGIVSQIKDGNYTICDVVSPLAALEKGQEFTLEDTYCQLVFNSKQVIGLPHIGELDYMNAHPVYQNLKLEAYLSAPIFIEDELFGTLNFTSVEVRPNGFSVHERNLILLMANSIGAYLQLRNKEARLIALNNQMKKFVGYVAHDLRNPIGSILTLGTLALRSQNDPERLQRILSKIAPAAESALELVTTILDGAALGTGKIELDIKEVELEALAQKALDTVSEFANEAQQEITTDTPAGAQSKLDEKRLLQALNNLLVNAIKYSPSGSQIEFHASNNEKGTLFIIRNKTASKQDSLNSHQQFASVGFGLEIVRDILSAHNSELITEQTGEEFESRFTLPQSH